MCIIFLKLRHFRDHLIIVAACWEAICHFMKQLSIKFVVLFCLLVVHYYFISSVYILSQVNYIARKTEMDRDIKKINDWLTDWNKLSQTYKYKYIANTKHQWQSTQHNLVKKLYLSSTFRIFLSICIHVWWKETLDGV